MSIIRRRLNMIFYDSIFMFNYNKSASKIIFIAKLLENSISKFDSYPFL